MATMAIGKFAVDKKKNHDDLILTHKNMGWDLLQERKPPP
jgi:hypothetical protein